MLEQRYVLEWMEYGEVEPQSSIDAVYESGI